MSVSTFNLTAFTALATADWMAVGDASDTTQSAHGSLDKITIPNFFASIPTPVNVTSASATALAVGRLGATTPAFTVDSSTGSQVAGLKVVGAVTTGTVAVVVTDSGAVNTNLTINALGSGTIGIGSVSTGRVTITPVTTITGALTLSAALTYGGVTLSNAVTGTGNMVLSASPTLTGTLTCATVAASGNISTTNGTLSVDLDTATQGATVAITTQSITIPSGLFSTRAVGTQQAIAHQMAAGSESARLFLVTAANSQTISGPRVIFVGHEGTFASPAATANGSVLGSIEFEGYTNAYTISGARIFATTTQLWTATAMGTKLSFDVVANGTTSNTTALTLGQDSSATFAGAVSGITALAIGGALSGVTTAAISGLVTSTKTGQFLFNNTATTGNVYLQLANTSGQIFLGIESSAGGSIVTGSTGYDSFVTGQTGLVLSGDNGTTVGIRVTSTGTKFNAGIALSAGTVPSNGIQFGTSAPGSLANGQMWYDGTDFKVRTGGATKTITIA